MLGIYILWLRGQGSVNEWLRQQIAQRQRFVLQHLSRLGLGGFVEADQVRMGMQRLRQLIHWSLILLISYLLIPLLLGLFPPTQGIAEGLRGQIRDLLLSFLGGVVQAIPNLLSIAVILAITILAIRISNAWFHAVDRGRVRIPGFYQEWALPTARLAAILLSLAGLAAAFPYIPGSDSKVFQGAGLLVGVLAALGSSAIASNIISGLMLIYTRAFRKGDRVEINGVVGVVQDRALLVTRLQTPRNELVSIPNATVIGASVVNFSFSRREIRQPVALATTITIGYDVPWRQVHELMLGAARSVEGITDEIEPFVLQTSLNDFHISYELTAFVRDPATYRQTLSELLAALQDQFAAADVEILSPGYHAIRNGNRSTVPKTDLSLRISSGLELLLLDVAADQDADVHRQIERAQQGKQDRGQPRQRGDRQHITETEGGEGHEGEVGHMDEAHLPDRAAAQQFERVAGAGRQQPTEAAGLERFHQRRHQSRRQAQQHVARQRPHQHVPGHPLLAAESNDQTGIGLQLEEGEHHQQRQA